MSSTDFQDFYWSCFDKSFGATHNGLNVLALLRLEGDEYEAAERLILQAIQTEMDARPIRAAGYLKLKSASPFLKQRLASSIDGRRPYNRVHSAWALYQIEKYSEAANTIIGILTQLPGNDQWSRMTAVGALADFGAISIVVTTLFETLLDEDGFVASRATDSLKSIFESRSDIIFWLNEIKLMQSGHKAALAETTIRSAVEQIKQLANMRL